jgi:putative transcriptional regulator
MTERFRKLLPEYVFGAQALERPDVHVLEAALRSDASLAAELRTLNDAWACLAETLRPEGPSQSTRERTLAAAHNSLRYERFVPDLCMHFDLASTVVFDLLMQMANPARWLLGPMPGIHVMHFEAGPRAVAPDTGFVRLAAGLHFPRHRHVGHEVNYVLSGSLRDGDGTLVPPGQAIIKTPGSVHEFSVGSEAEALIAVVQAGFELV